MIGGEHKNERYSERLEKAQNQPRNRGYLPGTQTKTGGYSTNTLQGNWCEEHADAGFYDGKAALPTEQEKYWTTTYRQMVGNPKSLAQAELQFDQCTMIEIVDRVKSSVPGHQPHLDPHRQETLDGTFQTVSQATYVPPQAARAAELAYVAPVLSSVPGAQALGVLLRLRRQLELLSPGKSAFPGGVTRAVRLALLRSSTDAAHTSPASRAVNAVELQEGLARVGVQASPPECTALVRHYDCSGGGTACVEGLVKELRGVMNDRREELVKSVYGMLEAMSPPDRVVRLSRMLELIDVSQLDAVSGGEISADEALRVFEEQWDARSRSMYINREAFITYFGDASFEFPRDGDFELFLRNVWHLSGGNGTSANTSCRRVEVVHLNGRVTIQEIKNDLDIKGSLPAIEPQLRANLAKQGIKDVKSMRLVSAS